MSLSTKDPDEEADLFIDDNDILFIDDVQTPYMLSDVAKIKYEEKDNEIEDEYQAVNIHMKSEDIISFIMSYYEKSYAFYSKQKGHYFRNEVAMTAFKALITGEEFVIVDNVLHAYFGSDSNVVIPNGVEVIDHFAFSEEKGISEVQLPDSVKILEVQAFCGMQDLESILLNEGILKIGYAAFACCCKLKKIVIPSTVKRIEESAFYGSGLESITILSENVEIGDKAYELTPYGDSLK